MLPTRPGDVRRPVPRTMRDSRPISEPRTWEVWSLVAWILFVLALAGFGSVLAHHLRTV